MRGLEAAGHFGGLDGAKEEVAGAEFADDEKRESGPGGEEGQEKGESGCEVAGEGDAGEGAETKAGAVAEG